jgi:type VI secretion system protein ImpA
MTMPIFDVNDLLPPISPDEPCGADLEYSPEYVELLGLTRGTPDVEYGKMRQEAAEPDWKGVKAVALRLLERTRDLRLAIWLTRALLAQHGFAGLDDGLALVEAYLDRHWDMLHPQLDAEDDNDPTARINTLSELADKEGLLRQALAAALVESPVHGRYCLRDIEVAEGELSPRAGEGAADKAAIEAAFKTANIASVADMVQTLGRCAARVEHIEAMVTDKVGHARGLSLRALSQLLRRAAAAAEAGHRLHPEWRSAMADASSEGGADAAGVQADGGAGALNSREDVARLLDRICDYYASQEPGSPVPLLLRRAQRLVGLSFVEILNDLSPQSLADINKVAGLEA